MDWGNRSIILEDVQCFVVHGSYKHQLLPCGPSTPAKLNILYLINSEKEEFGNSPTVWSASHHFEPEAGQHQCVFITRPFFLFLDYLDLFIRPSALLPKGKHRSCLSVSKSMSIWIRGLLHALHPSITWDCSLNLIYSLLLIVLFFFFFFLMNGKSYSSWCGVILQHNDDQKVGVFDFAIWAKEPADRPFCSASVTS